MTGRLAPSGLLLLLGVVVVQLVRTDAYLRYVKSWLAVPLTISGSALVLLGAAGVFAACREGPADGPRPSQAGWLLVVPVGLILLVDPAGARVLRPAGQRHRGVGPAGAPHRPAAPRDGACCAADGRAARVFVATSTSPEADTWWRVEGRAQPTAGASVTERSRADARVVADVVTPIDAPKNPYSY